MSNKDISRLLKRAAALMELHGADPFKAKAYTEASFHIEKLETPLHEQSIDGMVSLGISKNMAGKVQEILLGGTFKDLSDLEAITPAGVADMLEVKGLGAKKVRVLWQELGLESIDQLRGACESGQVAGLKGFGEKTQVAVLEQIGFMQASRGKLLFAQAEPIAQMLAAFLKEKLPGSQVAVAGQVRRCLEVVDTFELIVGGSGQPEVQAALAGLTGFAYSPQKSGPFTWRGTHHESGVEVVARCVPAARFAQALFLSSAAGGHLAFRPEGEQSLYQLALTGSFDNENALYEQAGMAFVPPEMREGVGETALAKAGTLPVLVEMEDLKGVLHNHSTYSDGRHTLEDMARHCQALGYGYLGISDHSQSAFYANGLKADRIRQQHEEIDRLNTELAPFRIFKGIESDILNDGRLDYPDEILASFDFVVASVHANLNMDQKKATDRLLAAIANPFTTMLGHPTGRLLLKREGYPLDIKAVIDACADFGVMVEINANPLRLDLDWRWVLYALEKGVMLSINPDAHEKDGYADMRYGLLTGRKAGLTKSMTFNALTADEVAAFFEERKKKALAGR